MTNGILLAAFGRPEYMYMAAQLAGSIRVESPKVNITLLHDHTVKYLPEQYQRLFNQKVEIKKEHLYRNGKLDPGFFKVNIPAYLQYDNNLYLDVDAICLKDLTPIFRQKKDFAAIVVGSGKKTDKINYLFWATNENAWKYFGLKESDTYNSIQSSAMFFRKSELVDKLHKKWVDQFDYPKEKLANQWGNTIPDELIISGVCAQLQYDPSFNGPVVFFGFKNTGETLKQITDGYYLLAIYGPNGLVRSEYKDFYDRKMIKSLSKLKLNIIFKSHMLLRGKHAGPK